MERETDPVEEDLASDWCIPRQTIEVRELGFDRGEGVSKNTKFFLWDSKTIRRVGLRGTTRGKGRRERGKGGLRKVRVHERQRTAVTFKASRSSISCSCSRSFWRIMRA